MNSPQTYGLFAGRVGIVTGGGSGIGEACTRLLVASGARVGIADRSLSAASALAEELGGKTVAIAIETDVSDEAACERMVSATVSAFGKLDFAVNNAGVGNADKSPVGELSLNEWRRLMSVNLDGIFLSMKAELPALLAAGGGSIVNVSSVMGAVATAGAGAYVASKHAVVGLSKAAALDYASLGIRVNAVGPGYVETPMLAGRTEVQREDIASRHPLGRLAHPDEIANVILFLASDSSSFVTGSFYPVDGGYVAR